MSPPSHSSYPRAGYLGGRVYGPHERDEFNAAVLRHKREIAQTGKLVLWGNGDRAVVFEVPVKLQRRRAR